MIHTDSDNNEFIETSKIIIIDKYVPEKIETKFLNNFLVTTLQYNNINVDQKTYIWYNYIEYHKLYEIYVIQHQSSNFNLYPNIFETYYKQQSVKTIDIFIKNNCFSLYKYGKLYAFKTYKESSYNDIKLFAEQKYQLKIDNIYHIDNNLFDDLLHKYIDLKYKSEINFKQLIVSKQHFYFIYYSLSVIIVFLIYSFNNYTTKIDQLIDTQKHLSHKIKSLQFATKRTKQPISKLIDIFKYLKISKITIDTAKYEQNKINLILIDKNKAKLLNFTKVYHCKLKIKSLNYVQSIDKYKMVIIYEI